MSGLNVHCTRESYIAILITHILIFSINRGHSIFQYTRVFKTRVFLQVILDLLILLSIPPPQFNLKTIKSLQFISSVPSKQSSSPSHFQFFRIHCSSTKQAHSVVSIHWFFVGSFLQWNSSLWSSQSKSPSQCQSRSMHLSSSHLNWSEVHVDAANISVNKIIISLQNCTFQTLLQKQLVPWKNLEESRKI